MRELSDETEDESDSYGESMVNSVVIVSQLLLGESIPGESYLLKSENDVLSVESSKISHSYFDLCGTLTNSVELNEEFIDLKYTNISNGEYLDCTIMITSSNMYELETLSSNYNNNHSSFQSDFLMLDVSSLDSNGDDGENENSEFLSDCNPIILTFNHSNTSYFNYNFSISDNYPHFPLCSFYNTTTKLYSNNGCYLLYFNEYYSKCACVHNSFYGLTYEDFAPEINYWGKESWNKVSFENLIKYPLGWIAVGTWICMCLLLIVLFRKEYHVALMPNFCQCEKKDDKPLIAQYGDVKNHDKIRKILNNKELRLKYRINQEIRIVKDDKLKHRSYLFKFFHLFFLNMRNEHLWLGICFRDYGTSYTESQRILILMVRVLTSLCVSALFYGRRKESTIGDVSLMLYESLLGFIPMFVVQQLIKRHKPGINGWELSNEEKGNTDDIGGSGGDDERAMAMYAALQLSKIKSNSMSTDRMVMDDAGSGGSQIQITPQSPSSVNEDGDLEFDLATTTKLAAPESPKSPVAFVTKQHVFEFVNDANEGMEIGTGAKESLKATQHSNNSKRKNRMMMQMQVRTLMTFQLKY